MKIGNFTVKGFEQSDHIYKTRHYLAAVAKKAFEELDPYNGIFVDAINEVEKIRKAIKSPKSRDEDYEVTKKLYSDYLEQVYNKFDNNQDKIKLMGLNAKINDLWRTAVKVASRDIVEVHHETENKLFGNGGSNADKYEFTLRKLADEKIPVSTEYTQSLVDRAQTRLKLTAHPTNCSNVVHTVLGAELENKLDDPNSTSKDIDNSMKEYLSVPVANLKKTPQTETQEMVPIRRNIYHAAKAVRRERNEALKKTGWADKGVKARTAVVKINDWDCGGDGDGNPLIDKQALVDGIKALRTEIKGLYLEDLKEVEKAINSNGIERKEAIGKLINSMKEKLSPEGGYTDINDFIKDLKDLKRHAVENPHVGEMISELVDQARDFGLNFAKIDLRHPSDKVNGAFQTILQAALEKNPELKNTIKTAEEYEKLNSEGKQAYITNLIGDKDVMKAMHALDLSEITAKHGDHIEAQRIFGRLKVVAENPDMVEEFIIAEAKKPEDVLTALALLKASGNEVCNEKAKIHIVSLLEDLPDLEHCVENSKTLAANKEYAKHLYYLQESRIMVAESDNRRRNGQSAGEVVNETIGACIKVGKEIGEIVMKTIPLEMIEEDRANKMVRKFRGQEVINGGGEDMARGAQNKATEIGFNQGYFAKKYDAETLLVPSCTIQGHQTKLLFSSQKTAAYTIEGMMSQTMYAIAGVEGEISQKGMNPDKEKLQTQARHDARIFHEEGRKWFSKYAKNPSFDKLFENAGAWVTGILSNMGSRPSKRGKSEKGGGVTVEDLVGANPKILDQRAITAAGLGKHSGSPSLTLLGQKEGTEGLLNTEEEKGRKPGNTYDNSKPDRNHMRANAIMLFNENFSKFWIMSGMERPKTEEVKKLAAQFDPDLKKINEPKITLAFFEQYVHDLARETYKAIHGIDPNKMAKYEKREFMAEDLLHDTWPELARQLYLIKKDVSFADAVETHLNKQFNANRKMVITPEIEELVRTTASATSRRNTADGMLGIYTELHKDNRSSELDNHKPSTAKNSYSAKIAEGQLKVIDALVELAKEKGIQVTKNYLDYK